MIQIVYFASFYYWDNSLKEIKTSLESMQMPKEIQSMLIGSSIFDCSSSTTSKTYRCIKENETFFCKEGSTELLLRENDMYRYFYQFSLGPEVLYFTTVGEKSYILTRSLEGSDGISKNNINDPEKLAFIFGKGLSTIHNMPSINCPFQNKRDEMYNQAIQNMNSGIYAEYLIPEGFIEGKKKFERLCNMGVSECVIHGDYCLPNIIIDNQQISGFIDLGNGGFGDSYYDLFWGLWTLHFNLKTQKYDDLFLNSYGIDKIDNDRIEFNRLISGFMD
jgi:kanamycin kinase